MCLAFVKCTAAMNRAGILSVFYLIGILIAKVVAEGDGMHNTVLGYNEYKRLNPNKEPTLCYDEIGVEVNGTLFTNFTCPLPNLDTRLTHCCNTTCCMPNAVRGGGGGDTSVTVAVTIVVVAGVSVTLCMVLYCCCCQKRPGIHEGKLIWIKKKKDKIVYEEGGVSPVAGSPADDNGDEELLGFVYPPDEKGHTDHSLEKRIDVDTPTQQKRVLPDGQDEKGGGEKQDRDLNIPLITIRKASTPGQEEDN